MEKPEILNEEHIKYLREFLGDDKVETFLQVRNVPDILNVDYNEYLDYSTVRNCLIAMEHSQDNPWWLSDDNRTIAYNQFNTDILLVQFNRFHVALETLLDRNIWSSELVKYMELKVEVENAYKESEKTQE